MACTPTTPSATTVGQSPNSAEALADMLLRAGVPFDVQGIEDLLAGIASAPIGMDPDAWTRLVALRIPPDLKERLQAMLADCRRDHRTRDEDVARRLADLRKVFRRRRLAGFIVPHADEHQNEQLAPGSERLTWLTGFTGSAGVAVVLRERAALFVDGRYTTQAAVEVKDDHYEICHLLDEPPFEWIAECLPSGGRLGFDPWLHTTGEVKRYRGACRKAGGRLVAVEDNPLDELWMNRPPPPIAPIVFHDLAYAGLSSAEKRKQVAEALARDKQDAAVVTAPDSIAWLLNIRGGDMPYTPAPLAFVLLYGDGRVDLFVDSRKFAAGTRSLLGDGVTVFPSDALGETLDRLGTSKSVVRLDDDKVPFWIRERLRRAGAELAVAQDPCALPKATKNECELEGMKAAHRRDGVALVRFFAWLHGAVLTDDVTEIGAAERLEAFRRDGDLFGDAAFRRFPPPVPMARSFTTGQGRRPIAPWKREPFFWWIPAASTWTERRT